MPPPLIECLTNSPPVISFIVKDTVSCKSVQLAYYVFQKRVNDFGVPVKMCPFRRDGTDLWGKIGVPTRTLCVLVGQFCA